MTILKLHNRRMYWQKNQAGGGLLFPRYGRFMCRDRFVQIMRALHFSDNSTAMPYGHADFDKLHKIRPLIDAVNKSFAFAWDLGGHVSVDEGMVGFRGRSFIRQFMPAKKTKYGLKIFILACSDTGFANSLKVEEGLRPGDKSRKDYGATVVKELATLAKCKAGTTMYADNWFTSIALAWDLVKKFKMHLVGTTKPNRTAFPDEVKIAKQEVKKLGRGFCRFASDKNTGIRTCAWIDNKVVNMISTRYSATQGVESSRKAKGLPGGLLVKVPELVDK
jgi:hypothetical protein